MVIAPDQFRDEELFETKEELETAGLSTVIASKQKGICKGKLGREAVAEIAPDNHELINSLVPSLLRIRNQKRLLYKELGFCKN